MRRLIYILVAMLLVPCVVEAQHLPERRQVRKGNKAYAEGDFNESIARYEEALKLAPAMYEPAYNLANGYYKAQRYDHAEKGMAAIAADSTLNDAQRAEAYYNLGNAQFQQRKLQEALESFKQSLRIDPEDEDARFNYAYTKKLLDQQNQQNQQDQNQQNKNDQQQKDQQNQNGGQNDQQQQQQQGDKQDEQGKKPEDDPNSKDKQGEQPQDKNDKDSKNDPQKGDPDKDGKDGKGEGAPQKVRMSDKEQEQMLDAIQAQENRTQQKLKDKKKAKGIIRLKKNW